MRKPIRDDDIKLLAVSYFLDGKNRTEIAVFLKVIHRSINAWIKFYLDFGLKDLEVKPRSGRLHRLNSEQFFIIKHYIIDNTLKSEGGRLQGKDIQEYIETTFGVTYQKNNIYHLLGKLNLSWITTRSKHSKQSVEAHKHFVKKFQIKRSLRSLHIFI